MTPLLNTATAAVQCRPQTKGIAVRRHFPPAAAAFAAVLAAVAVLSGQSRPAQQTPVYLNPDLPVEGRVDNLVAQMTTEERVSQLVNDAPAIDHLGIPRYNWWNECLHGVARAGLATVFPQAVGLAATWDDALTFRMATPSETAALGVKSGCDLEYGSVFEVSVGGKQPGFKGRIDAPTTDVLTARFEVRAP